MLKENIVQIFMRLCNFCVVYFIKLQNLYENGLKHKVSQDIHNTTYMFQSSVLDWRVGRHYQDCHNTHESVYYAGSKLNICSILFISNRSMWLQGSHIFRIGHICSIQHSGLHACSAPCIVVLCNTLNRYE